MGNYTGINVKDESAQKVWWGLIFIFILGPLTIITIPIGIWMLATAGSSKNERHWSDTREAGRTFISLGSVDKTASLKSMIEMCEYAGRQAFNEGNLDIAKSNFALADEYRAKLELAAH